MCLRIYTCWDFFLKNGQKLLNLYFIKLRTKAKSLTAARARDDPKTNSRLNFKCHEYNGQLCG